MLFVALLLTWPKLLLGQVEPTQRLEPVADIAVIGGLAAAAIAASWIEVDGASRLDEELFPFDQALRGKFSEAAHQASNALVLADLLLPIAVQAGQGIDARFGEFAAVYGEALVVSLALNQVTKRLVSRPRPYVYADDTLVKAYVQRAGEDTRLSFYSGHSAIAFTAAVAGAYQFALRSPDRAARAAVYGVELGLAAAVANLRVRAGRHFYSDVVVGALVGAAAGLLVPWLHRPAGLSYSPSGAEWAAMGGGLALGILASELWPFEAMVPIPIGVAPAAGGAGGLTLVLELDQVLALFQ